MYSRKFWKNQLKYETTTLSVIIDFMSKKRCITKKKTTYIILCFEILLIVTLLVGIGLYIYSQTKQEAQPAGNSIGESIEKQESVETKEEPKPLVQGEKNRKCSI